jgi:hypothetical protein
MICMVCALWHAVASMCMHVHACAALLQENTPPSVLASPEASSECAPACPSCARLQRWTATPDQIKAAYRKSALLHHPDKQVRHAACLPACLPACLLAGSLYQTGLLCALLCSALCRAAWP